jgi:hypothetical protein
MRIALFRLNPENSLSSCHFIDDLPLIIYNQNSTSGAIHTDAAPSPNGRKRSVGAMHSIALLFILIIRIFQNQKLGSIWFRGIETHTPGHGQRGQVSWQSSLWRNRGPLT